MLDRYGSRVTLTAGAVLMALGQVLMSQTETVGVAMIARIVLGAGDALTFASAIRLVPAWFPPGRVPPLTQLTGILGQVGQILSAVPFVAVLSVAGWTPAFSSAAALSAIAAVLVLARRPRDAAGDAAADGEAGPPTDPRGAGADRAPPLDAAGLLHPLHGRLPRHRVLDDVGLPVSHRGGGAQPPRRLRGDDRAGGRRDRRRSADRRAHPAAPAAPLHAGAC
ncbi:MFS transporter [Brachybacterium sp. GPGPB12]|uniref:MFS transporter n=1 Tax=Brachybacterium sp. GPGPB12 TaxID=3023517 RepID=UPI00313424E3